MIHMYSFRDLSYKRADLETCVSNAAPRGSRVLETAPCSSQIESGYRGATGLLSPSIFIALYIVHAEEHILHSTALDPYRATSLSGLGESSFLGFKQPRHHSLTRLSAGHHSEYKAFQTYHSA